jgi:aryl-alcohol dehydrogenase-like predicted oxidoreductase
VKEATARLNAALADRYTLTREMGAGGMATVYLAHDLKHGRDVALKVLKPDLALTLGAFPIPGSRKLERLEENLGAASLDLTADDLREIQDAASKIPVLGPRLPEDVLKLTGR